MALLLTLASGLFFLVGMVIYKHTNKKIIINNIGMSCASVVLTGLILFDLIPEIVSMHRWYLFAFCIVGLEIFIIIDKFIPHHHHDHHDNDELEDDHQEHLKHIGVVTMLALLLHNFVEGMALYGVCIKDIKSGVLMLVGIMLHNLPFGFQIASYNKHKLLTVLLVFSGFFGGLIFFFFGKLNPLLEGIVISITLGMLLHLLLFEFFKEVIENIKKKETIYGIIIGIVILLIINNI